jgi:hypothetical protein
VDEIELVTCERQALEEVPLHQSISRRPTQLAGHQVKSDDQGLGELLVDLETHDPDQYDLRACQRSLGRL